MKKIILVLLLVSTLMLCACNNESNNEEKDDSIDNNGVTLEDNEISKMGIFIGDQAYNFEIEDNEFKKVKLSDLKDKIVIINFWTTWNDNAKLQNDYIQEVYNLYKSNKEIEFVSINVTSVEKENLEYVIKYIQNEKYTFPIYFDLEGIVAEKYMIRSFPTTYIVNKSGYIADVVVNMINTNELSKKITDILEDEEEKN